MIEDDSPGWERHASKRSGALFLHKASTGESRWFEGWVEKKSRWYGRKYWFQPTTGRSEWELPGKEFSTSPAVATPGAATQQGQEGKDGDAVDRRENEGGVAADLPKPSNEKVKAWMAKIKAKKAEAAGGQHGDINSTAATGDGGSYTSHKRRRDEQQRVNEADDARSDDMELDDDLDDGQASAGQYLLPAAAGMHQPPLPPLPPPREDVPLVALRRERLRIACLERFVRENEQYGTMRGYSKTSRSCRDEGMFVGLGGMLGRFLWVQHMRQTMALASGQARRGSKAPPDPVFPSITDTDDKLMAELMEGGRSKVQADRTLGELADACRESAAELEAFLEAELPGVSRHIVTLEEEVSAAKGDIRMRQVTGKEARVAGPNPNASYSLKYVPPKGSGERETSFAITGAHLEKTWQAYCAHIQAMPPPPVWDSDFLRRLYCVLARYETLSATSDGYQMAFPASGFRLLRQLLDVDCECFASPLNCTLKRFCSVAYDTDKFFGSEGNFFESNHQMGSFEANPPFVEEVMERMVDHMHYLLERATGAMSFAIIVPGWNDTPSYTKMASSRFARPWTGYHVTLDKGKHNYRPGMQHRLDIEEKPSNCTTFLFFLQNEEGFDRWPVTEESLERLQDELETEARLHAERNSAHPYG